MSLSQQCTFCQQPSILMCVIRSLNNKYGQVAISSYSALIDSLILNDKHSGKHNTDMRRPRYLSYTRGKYVECVCLTDNSERMQQYLTRKAYKEEFRDLLQYYKYRVYVPTFTFSSSTDTIYSYYYTKLKLYYNNIKKRLNLTVQPSQITPNSQDDCTVSGSQRGYKDILTGQYHEEYLKSKPDQNTYDLRIYKSESKALQQMIVSLGKQRWDHIQALNTEDCFAETGIFQQIYNPMHMNMGKSNTNVNVNSNAKKGGSMTMAAKSTLYKKIISSNFFPAQQPNKSNDMQQPKRYSNEKGKTNVKVQHNDKSHNRTPSRDMNRHKSNKNLMEVDSPYKKRANSYDRQRGKMTAQSLKQIRSLKSIKISNQIMSNFKKVTQKVNHPLPSNHQIPMAMAIPIKMNANLSKNHFHPNPTPLQIGSARIHRNSIQLDEKDNIFTMRKKKLQALQQKHSTKHK